MIFADFYRIGKIPVLMILLKIMPNGRVIFSPQCSIIRTEMLSGPYALLTFKLFMMLRTIQNIHRYYSIHELLLWKKE